MRKCALLFLCVVLFFIVTGVTATASFAGMQFDLTPGFSASEEYTDNLFLADRKGDQEAEWITILSPRLTLNGSGATSDLSLGYSTEWVYYSREGDSPPLRHSLDFSYRQDVSRKLSVSVSDAYSYTDVPFSQNATAEGPDIEFIDRQGRESYYTNSADVTIDYQLGRHDRLNLGYGHYLRENREPIMTHDVTTGFSHEFGKKDWVAFDYSFRDLSSRDPEIEESRRNRSSIDLTYWPFLHTGLEGDLQYTKGEFDGDTDDFDQWKMGLEIIREVNKHLDIYVRYQHVYMDFKGDEIDYQVYDPSIGVNYAWSEDTFVDFHLGYFYLDNDPGKEDEKGISIDGNIGKTWGFKRGSVSLNGGAGYDEDYFGSENLGFTVYQDIGLSGYYKLTKRLTGRIFADYRRDEYVNREPERTDQSYNLGGGLTYSPLPWLRIMLDENYRYMDSDDPDQNYDENRVILRITLIPDPWRLN